MTKINSLIFIVIAMCLLLLSILGYSTVNVFSYWESPSKENGNIRIFIHEIMQSSEETGFKRHSEKPEKINLIALKGEYEPGLFSVYCRRGCKNIMIQSSALKMKSDLKQIISSENIEINFLKMGNALYGVHDWILVPAKDSFNVKGEVLRFWINIHVPLNAVSGSYQGILTITSNGNGSVEVPLVLNVLPQKLEDPENVHFVMLYTVSPYGQYFKSRKYEMLKPAARKFYRDLKSHGMTAISPKNSDWPYKRGKFDGLRAEVRTAMEVGFHGPVLWYMSSLINGAKGGKQYAHYDGKCDNWDESRDLENLKKIITDIKEIEKKQKWPEVVFITVDEPGTQTENRKILDLRMIILEKTLKIVYELGARGATTLTEPVDNKHNKPPFVAIPDDLRNRWERVRPFCAIRIYGYGYPQGKTNLTNEKNDAFQYGHEMWFYSNKAVLGNNRYLARVFYGLWGWKVGAQGLSSWTYPGKRTVQWEIVREGIDDFKYLRLIRRLSEQRSENDKTRIAAEDFLRNVSENVILDNNGYIKDWGQWKEFDFNRFREQAGSIIQQLSQ
jgi:hypothetical protein